MIRSRLLNVNYFFLTILQYFLFVYVTYSEFHISRFNQLFNEPARSGKGIRNNMSIDLGMLLESFGYLQSLGGFLHGSVL